VRHAFAPHVKIAGAQQEISAYLQRAIEHQAFFVNGVRVAGTVVPAARSSTDMLSAFRNSALRSTPGDTCCQSRSPVSGASYELATMRLRYPAENPSPCHFNLPTD
jgi:hypothetical protein